MFEPGVWTKLSCVSTEDIQTSIEAMEKLLASYYQGVGLDDCPLCAACEECFLCPWVIISGECCYENDFYFDIHRYKTQFMSLETGIERLRKSPKKFPEYVAQRILELELWIHVYYAEAYVRAANRMKYNNTRIVLDCHECGTPMELHVECPIHGGTHWYCAAANCGTIVRL